MSKDNPFKKAAQKKQEAANKQAEAEVQTAREPSTEIEIWKIHPFANHPFHVADDEDMQKLKESIRENGVIMPVIVREAENGRYEMISGHRRQFAADAVGLKTIPAIIRNLSDEDATILMVDSNVQRENILPSERAFAFKMKMDAMKRQGRRTDLIKNGDTENATSGHDGPKLTSESIGDEAGVSSRQVKRYIRLTELVPELLEMTDEKKLSLVNAVEISYLDKDTQNCLLEYIRRKGNVKADQIASLRRQAEEGGLKGEKQILEVLEGTRKPKKTSRKVSFSERTLKKYFPADMTGEDIEKVFVSFMEEWKNGHKSGKK